MVETWAKVIFQLGVPTVFAAALLYFVLVVVQNHLTQIVKMEETRLMNQLTWQKESLVIFHDQHDELVTQTQLFRDMLAIEGQKEKR